MILENDLNKVMVNTYQGILQMPPHIDPKTILKETYDMLLDEHFKDKPIEQKLELLSNALQYTIMAIHMLHKENNNNIEEEK